MRLLLIFSRGYFDNYRMAIFDGFQIQAGLIPDFYSIPLLQGEPVHPKRTFQTDQVKIMGGKQVGPDVPASLDLRYIYIGILVDLDRSTGFFARSNLQQFIQPILLCEMIGDVTRRQTRSIWLDPDLNKTKR